MLAFLLERKSLGRDEFSLDRSPLVKPKDSEACLIRGQAFSCLLEVARGLSGAVKTFISSLVFHTNVYSVCPSGSETLCSSGSGFLPSL